MSDLILPPSCRPWNALRVNVVFYRWPAENNRITVGFPEKYPAPRGAEKIVCTTTREVEKYSEMIRQQERDDAERTKEQREAEGYRIAAALNSELNHLMATARNEKNREFLRLSKERLEKKRAEREKEERVSYMHAEAFEAGKDG